MYPLHGLIVIALIAAFIGFLVGAAVGLHHKQHERD